MWTNVPDVNWKRVPGGRSSNCERTISETDRSILNTNLWVLAVFRSKWITMSDGTSSRIEVRVRWFSDAPGVTGDAACDPVATWKSPTCLRLLSPTFACSATAENWTVPQGTWDDHSYSKHRLNTFNQHSHRVSKYKQRNTYLSSTFTQWKCSMTKSLTNCVPWCILCFTVWLHCSTYLTLLLQLHISHVKL